MIPHAPGQCKGWRPGVRTAWMCAACWADKNPATQRGGKSVPAVRAMPANATPALTPAPPVADSRPPCVWLGDVIKYCSRGNTNACHHPSHPTHRCTTGPNIPNLETPSCLNCKLRTTGPLPAVPGVTLAITEWGRPAALTRLRRSIEQHLPGYPVEVEDTGGNLSAGRNRLYHRITTPYLVIMEEDFVAVPETGRGLQQAASILDHDTGIAGVGGVVREGAPGRVRWGHNFYFKGNVCHIRPSQRPIRKTPAGVTYRPCDLVLNWGVFRTDLFRRIPWDADYPIAEHKAYFYRASREVEFAFFSGLMIRHLRERPTVAYRQGRSRTFPHVTRKKLGFRFATDV